MKNTKRIQALQERLEELLEYGASVEGVSDLLALFEDAAKQHPRALVRLLQLGDRLLPQKTITQLAEDWRTKNPDQDIEPDWINDELPAELMARGEFYHAVARFILNTETPICDVRRNGSLINPPPATELIRQVAVAMNRRGESVWFQRWENTFERFEQAAPGVAWYLLARAMVEDAEREIVSGE